MPNIRQIVLQEQTEKTFAKKHIDAKIRKFIEDDYLTQQRIIQGVAKIETYISKDYYESKNVRIKQLIDMDLTQLVTDVFVGVSYQLTKQLFTASTAMIAGRLGFDDKRAAITTTAEIMALLASTDAYDITKEGKYESIYLISRMNLPDDLVHFIRNSRYLPPMVCIPLKLENNRSSGYLTYTDSLILGSGNHHDEDICIDVLNIMNSTPLRLSTEFLCKVEENPNTEFTVANAIASAWEEGTDLPEWKAELLVVKQKLQWAVFKTQSYAFYIMLAKQDNVCYLTHKVDKRGRIYSQGYHCNTQGTSFKKASIELANEELVTGVPTI